MTMDNDFEELMHSYGLDPSDPNHLDELIYRINAENDNDPHIFDPDSINDKLSEYVDLNEYYDEYSDADDELLNSEDC